MEFNWIESCVFGLFYGLLDIIPVSAQAHSVLLLKFFGVKASSDLMDLLIHLAIFAALYYSSQTQLIRMRRACALARIPKRKRKRPLDVRSLMDLSLLKTMAIPVIIGLLVYSRAQVLSSKRILVSVFLFINGVILYVPQFLPGSNRDSRTLSRVEGLCMGAGGALSVLPGISPMGTISSVASVCGVDKRYGYDMTCLLCMVLMVGRILYNVLALISGGMGGLSFLTLLGYILAGVAAFGAAYLALRLLRRLAAERGFAIFAYYCWGMALFTFILYLAT